LPAADVHNDPTLVDADMLRQAQVLRDMPAPVAASAADFFDADDRSQDEHSAGTESAAAASAASGNVATAGDNAGLDEYFDSAPIPGVDLSEVPDPAGRNKRRD
jgi:HemY protein